MNHAFQRVFGAALPAEVAVLGQSMPQERTRLNAICRLRQQLAAGETAGPVLGFVAMLDSLDGPSLGTSAMKVKIEIDCTPIEARDFLGLPDVKPMQEAMMDQMQAKMQENMDELHARSADADLVLVRSEDRRTLPGYVHEHGRLRRRARRSRRRLAALPSARRSLAYERDLIARDLQHL